MFIVGSQLMGLPIILVPGQRLLLPKLCSIVFICSILGRNSITSYVVHVFSWFMAHLTLKDVTMATLYVSSKMHDTLKKPRDLLMVSYAVRFPELAAKAKHGGGEVDIDPNVGK